jgi:site-specific DNA-methyltransferase (adenine-specific)
MDKLILGDCLEILKKCSGDKIDSIVTDPPYGISFMGKKWDYDVPSVDVWQECLRVLKPGGHILVACGTRTQHRMCVNIEDAGFEIRDIVAWVYGSGFPKSLNIGKAVDKKLGNERESIGVAKGAGAGMSDHLVAINKGLKPEYENTKGTSEWEGWGTALKPAMELWTLARKPLSEKTVAENVLKWGVGGLNIDGCRVETKDNLNGGMYSGEGLAKTVADHKWGFQKRDGEYKQPTGRFPANLIHDGSDEVKDLFPETKPSKSANRGTMGKTPFSEIDGSGRNPDSNGVRGHNDNGGSAARFFYVAKASKRERNMGCEGLEKGNNHSTVKPLTLMRYLCRLITPPKGTVLDPYMGSGSTGVACKIEGFDFIGIEREPEYLEIAKKRIEVNNG